MSLAVSEMDYQALDDDQWADLLKEVSENPPPLPRQIIFIRTEPTKRQVILSLLAEGLKQTEIAARLGVTPSFISKVKHNAR